MFSAIYATLSLTLATVFTGTAGNNSVAVVATSSLPSALQNSSLSSKKDPCLSSELGSIAGHYKAFIALSTALGFTLLSPPLSAGVEVYDLINKMSHSYRELNYQGVFSFQQGSELHSLKVTHGIIDGEEFERLEHLDTTQGDIIRRGHDLNCSHPGHQMLRKLSGQFDAEAPVAASAAVKIADYYQIMQIGNSRVAGRKTLDLLLSPKDEHRFTHRLSLDQDTGLLLKSLLLAADGTVLEQFQFVDITIGQSLTKAFFELDTRKQAVTYVDQSASQHNSASVSSSGWSVKWVPQGYLSVAADQDMATFTDGLSAFSVFLEAIDAQATTRGGHSQRGATIAYSMPTLMTGRPHRVTVVGEIPRHTAQKVASSVALQEIATP